MQYEIGNWGSLVVWLLILFVSYKCHLIKLDVRDLFIEFAFVSGGIKILDNHQMAYDRSLQPFQLHSPL